MRIVKKVALVICVAVLYGVIGDTMNMRDSTPMFVIAATALTVFLWGRISKKWSL